MPVALVGVPGSGKSDEQQCDERDIFHKVETIFRWTKKDYILSFDSNFLPMDGVFDTQHSCSIFHTADSKPKGGTKLSIQVMPLDGVEGFKSPRQFCAGNTMSLELWDILRKLNRMAQPFRSLVNSPVVYLRLSPNIPQFTDRNVQVVLPMKSFLSPLVPSFIVQFLS